MPAVLGNVLKAAEHVLNRQPMYGALSPLATSLCLGINWNMSDSSHCYLLIINH